MSSPQFPDDPNTPQQPATPQPMTPQPEWPTDTGATPAMPPGAYPPGVYPSGVYPTSPGQYPPPAYPSAPGQYSPGTYPPAPGQYSAMPGQYPPPTMPYYGPPSVPLQPGQSYSPPPPGAYPAPPTIPLPGYGMPAPSSQYGMPGTPATISQTLAAALSTPMVAPTPNIRQGFMISGIGGIVALLAYFVFQLPWFWPMWLVPALAALIAGLGFFPALRNRAYGPMTPRYGAIATMTCSVFGLLFLFFVWGRFGYLGSWIVALGLGAGIVGGVLIFRETQPPAAMPSMLMMPPMPALPSMPLSATPAKPASQTEAPTQMPPPSPAIQTATDSAKPAPRQTLSKPGQAGKHGTANPSLGIIGLILVFIVEGWGLIYKIALVILVIVGVVFFINEHVGLNEHSSCQQFEQADSGTQNQVLQDMMNAHHDSSSISLARASLTFYCTVYGGSAPIDGIYGSGGAGQ